MIPTASLLNVCSNGTTATPLTQPGIPALLTTVLATSATSVIASSEAPELLSSTSAALPTKLLCITAPISPENAAVNAFPHSLPCSTTSRARVADTPSSLRFKIMFADSSLEVARDCSVSEKLPISIRHLQGNRNFTTHHSPHEAFAHRERCHEWSGLLSQVSGIYGLG